MIEIKRPDVINSKGVVFHHDYTIPRIFLMTSHLLWKLVGTTRSRRVLSLCFGRSESTINVAKFTLFFIYFLLFDQTFELCLL